MEPAGSGVYLLWKLCQTSLLFCVLLDSCNSSRPSIHMDIIFVDLTNLHMHLQCPYLTNDSWLVLVSILSWCFVVILRFILYLIICSPVQWSAYPHFCPRYGFAAAHTENMKSVLKVGWGFHGGKTDVCLFVRFIDFFVWWYVLLSDLILYFILMLKKEECWFWDQKYDRDTLRDAVCAYPFLWSHRPLSLSLSVSLSLSLSVCLFVSLSPSLSLSVCLYVCLLLSLSFFSPTPTSFSPSLFPHPILLFLCTNLSVDDAHQFQFWVISFIPFSTPSVHDLLSSLLFFLYFSINFFFTQ